MKVNDKIKELQKIKEECGNIDLDSDCVSLEKKVERLFDPIFYKYNFGCGDSTKVKNGNIRIFSYRLDEEWDGLSGIGHVIPLVDHLKKNTEYSINPVLKHNWFFGTIVEIWVPIEEIL